MTEVHWEEGRVRTVVEAVTPQVDCGRFPVKRVVGDLLIVEADCFADGHDAVVAELLWRREEEKDWRESPMAPLPNDRWRAGFRVESLGHYRYTVRAWVDRLLSWRRDLARREDPDDIRVAARLGAGLIADAAKRARGEDAARLEAWSATLGAAAGDASALRDLGLDPVLGALVQQYGERRFAVHSPRAAARGRPRARPLWRVVRAVPAVGEPRSRAARDASATWRRGSNTSPSSVSTCSICRRSTRSGGRNARERTTRYPATAGEPGSPWAIGAAEGGHTEIHPELGTLEDFRRLVAAARVHGLEIALDIAYQCAPDHPYVRQHPEWFRRRPDGKVQYAENPPKKYEDIYPFDFECDDWRALWQELLRILLFWASEDVTDLPHRQPAHQEPTRSGSGRSPR